MDEFTGLKVTRDQFTLRKCIVNSQTKLALIEADLDLSTEHKTNIMNIKLKPDYRINEAFQKALTVFRPWLIEVCNVDRQHEKDVVVTGVELRGDEDKATWKIFGTNFGPNKQRMPFSTHKAHFDGSDYSFEKEVWNAANDLEAECFEYCFNDARAEPTLFKGSDNAEEPEEIEENE